MRILSLCDLTGEWPRPYAEAGYEVIRIEIDHGQDVRDLQPPENVHGILAAPPCRMFSLSRNGRPSTPEQMHEAIGIVDACLRMVAICNPVWWALENPKGKLNRYLGPPTVAFHPWWYGDGYTKYTQLWGDFNLPKRTHWTETEQFKEAGWARHNYPCQHYPSGFSKSQARAITPPGFARAFFEANP